MHDGKGADRVSGLCISQADFLVPATVAGGSDGDTCSVRRKGYTAKRTKSRHLRLDGPQAPPFIRFPTLDFPFHESRLAAPDTHQPRSVGRKRDTSDVSSQPSEDAH